VELEMAIKGRRSVRKFKPTPVSKEVLERVLDLATWAPSGWNKQEWFFAVVQGEKREELQRLFSSALPEIRPILEHIYPDKPAYVEELLEFFDTYGGAPVLVLAYAGVLPDGSDDILSTTVALQNLFLSAHEAGLGTTWTSIMHVREREINEMLGIEGRKLVCITPLGYPSGSPPPPPRREGRVIWVGF
jgi:nitroreductase